MASNMDGEMITNLMPGDLEPSSDNLRRTPDVESDTLAKDIAREGLLCPLIITKDNKIIDGNRRHFVGCQMQKGYETTLDNGMSVTLYLPKSWRVWRLNKTSEELGLDEILRLRLAANSGIPFAKSDVATQIDWAREDWCNKRDLTKRKVGHNAILHGMMVDDLCKKFGLSEVKIKEYLKYLRIGEVRVTPRGIKPELYGKDIGCTLGRAFDGIPENQIQPIKDIALDAIASNKRQSEIARILIKTKKENKKPGAPPLPIDFKERLSIGKSLKSIQIDVYEEIYERWKSIKDVQPGNLSWDEWITPIVNKSITKG